MRNGWNSDIAANSDDRHLETVKGANHAGSVMKLAGAVALAITVASWSTRASAVYGPTVPPGQLPIAGQPYATGRALLLSEGFAIAPDPVARPDARFPELNCARSSAHSCLALFTWKNTLGGTEYVILVTPYGRRKISYVGIAPSVGNRVSIVDLSDYYIVKNGQRIFMQLGSNYGPGPVAAMCNDGHESALLVHGKTCSVNGGIRRWRRPPPIQARPQ